MKKIIMAALAVVTFVAFTSQADARHRHRHYKQIHHQRTDRLPTVAHYGDGNIEYSSGHIVSHPTGCPGRAFCGCGVSVKVFGRPIRNLFLASNWFKFPRANPAPGMVAVRNHHVMYIMAYDNGAATVYDPNSGGRQTRIHTRSLRGYAIVNPHGSRMAAL